MVRNMAASIDFYIKIGFGMTNSWIVEGKIRWCWLLIGEAALMLQEYNTNTRHKKQDEGVSIYFICEDALTIYDHVRSSGLPVSEPFVGNNLWVVRISDPDVPEETRYADWKTR